MSKELSTEKVTSAPERFQQRPVVAPLVDVYENHDEILVQADLPGVKSDDVSVRLEKNELRLYARRQAAWGRNADYERTFLMPRTVEASKIDAQLKDGVLTLRLPKTEAAKPRQIAVRSS